jgi:hypothetical protein
MQKTATKPPKNDLYETDFYAWTQEQARLLRERRWDDLDLENLVDEVASVGSSDKREIRRRLAVLLAHLLKWKFQPGRRGPSWKKTISQQRNDLLAIIEDSPSLRDYILRQAQERYLGGVLKASEETGIAIGLFPEECPFTPEQVLDKEFFPEDRSIE